MPFKLLLNKVARKPLPVSNGIIVLDIGGELIKCFFINGEKENISIDAVYAIKQNVEDFKYGNISDITNVVKKCKEAIKNAEKKAGKKGKYLFIGIGSEFVSVFEEKQNLIRKDTEEKIDLPEIKNILHKIAWKSFVSARKEVSKTLLYNETDLRLIAFSTKNFKINGYSINNPIGFSGGKIEAVTYSAFASRPNFAFLITIATEFPFKVLGIVPTSYALTSDIKKKDSCIIIDIGGVKTDVIIKLKNKPVILKSFAIGSRSFIKRLSSEFEIEYSKAEKLFIKFLKGFTAKNIEKIIKKVIKTDITLWQNGVSIILSSLPKKTEIPHKICLCGGISRMHGIALSLRQKDFIKNIKFKKRPVIRFMDEERKKEKERGVYFVAYKMALLAKEMLKERNKKIILHDLFKKTVSCLPI